MRCKYFILSFLLSASLFARDNSGQDAYPLHRAQKVLTNVIIHDIFSPPVASRIYLYANIAAYEILIKKNTQYKSLKGQIKSFPEIPGPQRNVSLELAGVYAFLITGKSLIFSEQMMEDSLQGVISFYKMKVPSSLWEASLAYGTEVSEVILNWARQDRYADTRKLRRYSFLKEDGKWKPTPPSYMAAVEPNWGQMRTLVLDSATQVKPPAPALFSKEKGSVFYDLAYHVYNTSTTLSQEQKDIAGFWDCNPFAVNVHGHISYATKKLSPGGHWILIAGIASKKIKADIIKASAAYTLAAIALFDGFISCWDEKYRSNLVRPESFINAYIDESWKPLLQTPPFPEYTSGHSVISTACATVLNSFFGNDFSFVDTSETEYGLKARSFTSFTQASEEAAISRLYGGIHYLPAIEYGQVQGKKIGEIILAKIQLAIID